MADETPTIGALTTRYVLSWALSPVKPKSLVTRRNNLLITRTWRARHTLLPLGAWGRVGGRVAAVGDPRAGSPYEWPIFLF